MTNLSSKTTRKFIESINIDDWEIETDTGFEPIEAIHKTVPYKVFIVKTESGLELECADTHILFDEDGEEIYAKDCEGKRIQTKHGLDLVVSVEETDRMESMFDITINSKNHRFYTNDILSHNSTTITIDILHYILFNSHKTVVILANKEATAIEILNRIQLAYENLPKWLQQGVVEWNKKSFVLENGSRVIAAATSSSAIRGMSVNYLMIDEAAFLDNVWEDFFASVYPTISSGKNTKLVLVSTPNGMNHYYKLWMDAIAGRNMFYPFKVTWRDVPGRDEKWKEETIANTSYEQFLQEHECEFLGSSNTLISSGVLKNLVAEEPKEIIDNLRIYEYPVGNKDERDVDVLDDDPFNFSAPEKENEVTSKNHVYVIVVDTSHGKGLDYSAFSVIDITEYPFKQVATFYDQNISPLVYPHIIVSTAKKYNNAHILVETNDIGRSIVESINLDLEYENIIMSTTATNNENSKAEFGVRTTKKVKSIGCSVMKDLIESGRLIVKDQETINELCSFVIKGKSYEAQKGCHDDLVMTLVLFSWFTTDPYFEEIQQTQGIKEVFSNEAQEFEELLSAVAEVNELDDFDGFVEEGGENWQPL